MREAQIYKQYATWIGQGDADRLQAAEHFGVNKTTATYHLEKCVAEGLLERFVSWTCNNQTGWVYRQPSSRLSFYDVEGWDVGEQDGEQVFTAVFRREGQAAGSGNATDNPLSLIGG